MSIKESLKNVAGRIGISGESLRDMVSPKWGEYGDYFKNMVQDESQRGYSPETINNMRGVATGALTGARRSTLQDVNRNIAASGMGSTGMGIRTAANVGRDYMKNLRGANRDIDIAQAEAKRNDLWNAAQAWNMGLGGQQSAITQAAQTEALQVPALTGAHNVSFWGDFGDVTKGIGNLIGAGSGALGTMKQVGWI